MKKNKMKTAEEILKHPIVKRNKPIRRVLIFFQVLGFLLPLYLPLWVMVVYEVILFMLSDYMNDLFNQSVLIAIREIAETCLWLNRRL